LPEVAPASAAIASAVAPATATTPRVVKIFLIG
jgi:hypothetical protein